MGITALSGALAELAERTRRSTVDVDGPRGDRSRAGCGVIWRTDGMIVTNAHVARRRRARVTLADGNTYLGEVVRRDDRRDLALVSINARDLPCFEVGDSSNVRVGELVFALGNPLGMPGALSSGIIHAVGRVHPRARFDWIQADLRIMPGNSGGPLVTSDGRLIGINSMFAWGLALAVPAASITAFVEAMPEYAQVA